MVVFSVKIYSLVVITNIPLESGFLREVPRSGVTRDVPGGRVGHPEDQIEEENDKKLRKNRKNNRRMRKMRKCSSLAHPRLRVWLRPGSITPLGHQGVENTLVTLSVNVILFCK